MVKKIKEQLSEKDKGLFRLVTWCCLVVWMAFFMVFTVSIAVKARALAPVWYGSELWGSIMYWVAPIGIAFTGLMIVVVIGRLARRRLSAK